MFVETRGHVDCSSQVELQEQRQQLEHQAEHLGCFHHEDQKVRTFSADGSPSWRTLKVLTLSRSLSPCVCVSPLMFLCRVCVSMLLLLLPLLSGTAAAEPKVRLSDCLKEDDYGQLLQAVQTGLPQGNTSHHVIIVGAGVAGLTAAKLLQDAGHQVNEGEGLL